MPSRANKPKKSIWFIVCVALLLRLLVITVGHTYRITPRGDHFQFGWEVGRIARSIATGQGFSSPTDLQTGPTAWMAPGYTYLLSAVFKLFGVYSSASAWMILALNSLFAALTCWTIYQIGCRVFEEPVGRAAAWTWAVFPYLVYFPVRVVYDTSLSAFLLSLAFLISLRLADDETRSIWVVFGLLWGVMILINPSLLTMMLCCMGWVILRSGVRRSVSGAALCVLVAVLAVSPWIVRNYQVFGKFIFVRDNLPMELAMGNNDKSGGFWTREEHPANDKQEMQRFQQAGEINYMAERGREFRDFVRDNPTRFAVFSIKRAMYFWIAPPQAAIVNGYDFNISRHMNFFLEAVFAFGGLSLAFRRRKPEAYLFACLLLVYPLPYFLVTPYPRYKHIIEPEMLLLIVYLLRESRKITINWPPASAGN